ncbi:hypothetical protein BABINDRAFT_166431 [Babjeviella inositovora NRRL Y-12698]|uniref:F-box domain-containing protein n=1 Tax=Babjeviella inositovora NRRL Y-12698 TaxID=984486 RepID=A0A1E3QT38_9ASCO|nr:uncharacterized protein BABINDRAFT_166431 [Babjeviella inositovora NRRL Y-12698]ODQ80859.1 hypothetical protein BABINDRAFT_166431 [Babjeviella inositovora NRRL Y-12698]
MSLCQSFADHDDSQISHEKFLTPAGLPVDILCAIGCLLNPTDLLRLRLVNHYFNQVFTLDHIWRRICVERWSVPSDLTTHIPPSGYFKFFGDRNRTDVQIRKTISEITETDFPYKQKLALEFQILHMGHLSSSVLTSISCQSVLEGLHHRWIALQLLEALRFSLAFTMIQDVLQDRCTLSFEEVWLKLSGFDKTVNRLRHARDDALVATLRRYDTLREREPPRSPTGEALLMIKAFFHSVKLTRFARDQGNSKYIEDYFLFRVYSGEVRGHHLVVSSIIEKLCRLRAIDCYVTQAMFVVVDPVFPRQRAFIQLIRGNVRILVHSQILASLRRLVVNVTENMINNDILRPVTHRDLVEALLVKTHRNWAYEHVGEEGSRERAFPYSLVPVGYLHIDFIQTVYRMVSAPAGALRDALLWMHIATRVRLEHHNLILGLDALVPSCNFMKDANSFTMMSKFSRYNLEAFDRLTYTQDIAWEDETPENRVCEHPIYRIGVLVRHNSTLLAYVIVGWKIHEATVVERSPTPQADEVSSSVFTQVLRRQVFYNCLNERGDVDVIKQDSLVAIRDGLQDEVCAIARALNIGCFFERFSEKEQRFIANRDLKCLYPND